MSMGSLDPTSGSSAPVRNTPPSFRSHLLPRTRDGWVAALLFLGLLILAEPPVAHTLANRVEPWLLGMPFLFTYLLAVYLALVGVLIWALRRRV